MTRRRGAVVGPSLLAGLALACSLPPFGWWPLAFVGAGLLYWRLGGLPPTARLLAGFAAGLGCFGLGLYWLSSFNWYGAVVLVLVESLSTGVAAVLVPPRHARLPAFVGAFTLLEAVRATWPFGGLPVGGVYLGQAGGPLLGSARLGGPLLLTALVWLGGAAGAEVVLGLSRGTWARSSAPTARWVGWTGVAVVVVVAAAGALGPDGGGSVGRVTAVAVQGGGRRGTSQSEVPPAAVFAAQLAATADVPRAAPPTNDPRLVVWPEDVVSLARPLAGSLPAAVLARLARRLDATVLAGVTITVSDRAYRNEIAAWGPDGRIVAVFEKTHRVPFGEYVPYRGFFAHFANLSAVPLDAIPGHGNGLMATPAGPLGVLVSYDVFYPGLGRTAVRAGARLLVVPTNTSSYSASNLPTQEVAASRVQAVANGRDIVQAAPTGYSAVVDNEGNVRARSVLGARQVLSATVDLRTGTTLYVALGDAPVLGGAGLCVLCAWLVLLVRSRRGRRAPPEATTSSPDRPAPGAGVQPVGAASGAGR